MKKLFLFLFLAACSSKNPSYVQGHSTEELETYINEFEETFGVEVNFEVALVSSLSSGSRNSGECIHTGAFRRVEIREEIAQGKKLRLAVFHELGHCALGIGHWDGDFDIMNTHPNVIVYGDIDNFIEQMVDNYESRGYPRL